MEKVLTDKGYVESEVLCELLPWYVSRTLDEAELRAMEQHLRHCNACAEDLPVLRAVQESMCKESVTVLAPKPDARLFLANAGSHKLRSSSRTMTRVAAAVAATVAILAVVFNWPQSGNPTIQPAKFETATNAGSGATFDYVLLITLDPEFDRQAHTDALEALAPVSVAGPDSVGSYRVVIRLPAKSMHELQEFMKSIESDSAISSASVVAVELPVESR